MPKALNLVGQKFHKLTVLERAGKTPAGQWMYKCLCDCGQETVTRTGCLRGGHVKSCGCLSRNKGARCSRFKHGLSDKSHPLNKQYQREKYELFKYGLTPERKAALLESQGNGCAICGYTFGQKKGDMHVDHCHNTGEVRGLLCNECNTGIGLLRENAEIMRSAINYLENANAR